MNETQITIDPRFVNAAFMRFMESGQRTQIFYGGASSGKSVFLAQRCIYDLLRGGRNYLVCRAVGRTIRRSVFNELTKIIGEWGLTSLFTVNKSDMVITCANGYQIMFAGLDDVEKLKSMTPQTGVVTDVWVEEATETSRDSVKQLYKRQRGKSDGPKRMTLSFNPIMRTHWLFGEYFGGWDDSKTVMERDDLLIMKSTYRDNAFLTPEDRADLENERDPYFRAVYTEGQWGVLGDVIFSNWRTEDLSERRKHEENMRYGLDFGFAADPAAFVVTSRDAARKIIYIYDEVYERGLTNDLLAETVRPHLGGDYVYCDSAEPKSIAELSQFGIRALPADKGPDSVVHGIQWLQQHEIVIDPRCVNAVLELQQYQWQKDKDGNSIKKPVDRNDHLIDALRYAYSSEWKPRGVFVG